MLCRILMPHRHDITRETRESLKNWPREWRGIRFEIRDLPNSSIIGARNDLLWGGHGNEPFDESPDLYLFWDTDNTGTIDDFRLMHDLDDPVVFGLYAFTKPELEKYFVGGAFLEGFPGCWDESGYIPKTEKKVFRGGNLWAGLGFTLIRAQVLKDLDYPFVPPVEVKTPPEYPRGREVVTDDVGFCLNLHRAGIPVVLDGRVNVGHVPRKRQDEPEDGQDGPANMDAEAVAAAGVIMQMAERIKILGERR